MNRNNEDLFLRLKKIEGQIRGISAMLEEERDCEDIIIQLSAVNSAVTNLAKIIMADHIEHCLVKAIKDGDEQATIAKLKKAIDQFVKLK
ncbi:MAG TPA: metal-sensitive transcriptional regulator [Clostridia bacterium]|nr:metal-sensitive transcriptional regulator [Clostridia bacterium]